MLSGAAPYKGYGLWVRSVLLVHASGALVLLALSLSLLGASVYLIV